MSFTGILFCNNDMNQNSVSFMHMSNAYVNYVASLKIPASNTVGGVAETRTVLWTYV